MSTSILVAGSIAIDELYTHGGSLADGIHPKHIEDLSVSYTVGNLVMRRGGAGGNVALMLGLLSSPVTLFCAAGNNTPEYLEILKKNGIDMSLMTMYDDALTPRCIITTDDAERQITLFDSACEHREEWREKINDAKNIERVIVCPWQPAFTAPVFTWARENGVPILFDPGQQILDYTGEELREIIQWSEGVVVNEYEWQLLKKKAEWEEDDILRRLDYALITRGASGCDFYEGSNKEHIPACTLVKPVNPTGAGDAFRAGFLHGLNQGWEHTRGIKLGCALASLLVEQEGAQLETLDMEEVESRMKKAYVEV